MRIRALVASLIGLLCAAISVGVGELVAVAFRPAAAPVVAVANRVVLLTPESTKRSAISNFGGNDKSVLIGTVLVAIALIGALVGRVAAERPRVGLTLFVLLGAVGVWCALTDQASRASDAVPAAVGTVVGAAALIGLLRLAGPSTAGASTAGTASAADAASGAPPARRAFLVGAGGAAGLAAVTGFGGRAALDARFGVEHQRQAVRLPAPQSPAPPLAVGTDLQRSGVPYLTPAKDFYRVDTAISIPQVDPAHWQLRVHGMVDREITVTYQQLLARPLIERYVTLCCVSNPVGGPYISNARWLGARLADLLREAGVHAEADQLLMTSVDGMTIGAPTKVVLDGRDALIAVGMNGEPLPVAHGFPARIVVPGLYGYVSACKWVTDIEATTFARRIAYWVQGGWAQQTDLKLESRIDTPRSGATLTVGKPVPIAGVAWDQHVGVSAVEVQVDDGAWLPARLAPVPSTDTWRQWVVSWTPPRAGTYTLRVRATDGKGRLQTVQAADVFPSGATGWHKIVVRAA